MNFSALSLPRLFLRCTALFLFAGLTATAQQPAGDKSTGEIPRAGRDGVGMPKCEYCPSPTYSEEARAKKYEGVVVLNVEVTSEGKVTNIRVVKTPGLGLEEKSIEAVSKWRLTPALKDGKPVQVQLPIQLTFRLH